MSLRIRLRHEFSGARLSVEADFEVPPGFTVLFGPSGAGKSTILECVAGLLRAGHANVRLGNKTLADSARSIHLPPQQRGVGYMFQDVALFPHLTAEDNIGYGVPAGQQPRLVPEMMRWAAIEHTRSQKAALLSGGEKQRVALARVLVTEPKALLLDEPFSALDDERKHDIMLKLRAWQSSRQIPVIVVTHDREEALAIGDSCVVMDNGRVVKQGSVQLLRRSAN